MSDTVAIATLVGLTFLAAGFTKGVVGLGLPTVAMGLLSLVMAPAAAAALLIVPSLVTNVWQLLAGPSFAALVRRLASMMFAVLVGTSLSINILTGSSSSLASGALGAILAAYGAVGLAAPRFTVPPRAEPWLSPLIGLATGLITGATGVFAIPAVPYLSALGFTKDELIQALGLSFTVSTVALAAALALSGKVQWLTAGSSLLAILPALLGMFIGQRVRGRLQPEAFRRWFFIGLAVLGLYMLARALLPR
ncbi:sulfite exporter TauE/SafE family protein [Accumulibacter sp.]|uniref:sulfite exporter TauE/SafE family protein n=1 Tax=Accumulibacter sp. TaxID=2053492 RepID=UPI0028C38DE0|nr:sulfite exporter TauE/SafE family protein [Accumulibacter sp.]